jgi:hypothetical protein
MFVIPWGAVAVDGSPPEPPTRSSEPSPSTPRLRSSPRTSCVIPSEPLVREGHDLVVVAELLGHARLDQTRRYSLPTQADRQRAINSLLTDD